MVNQQFPERIIEKFKEIQGELCCDTTDFLVSKECFTSQPIGNSARHCSSTGGVKKSTKAQAELNTVLDKGVERFKKLSGEEQFAFKQVATKFTRTYGFVLQVVTFIDLVLHKQYIYLMYLLRKLPRGSGDRTFIWRMM